jgi:hypothetical protein
VRVPGAWSIAVGRSGGRAVERSSGRTIGSFGYLFLIAKIANSPLMFGNIGYLFCIAKSANDWRENRQREGAVTWRPRFGFGNIGKIAMQK